MSAPAPGSKTAGVIMIVLVLVLLIGYGVWIWISSTNKTGFFAPYNPAPEDTTGLYQSVPDSRFTPLTPEIKAKRDAMIEIARGIAATKSQR